ncbi:terminase large subunit [Variovorax sp. RB3P1]|uniref:terminase large subunit n=1 Tax=Variovorax sp. RB3P1 TaxID=3443732 RepID=UPI003F47144E
MRLLSEPEGRAEHLILAPTKEVADNSFKPAAAMVRADDELREMFHVQDHVRTITHRITRNLLKVVAADTDTVSGKKAGKVLVDEHWIFGKRANADGMFMEATGGQVSRNEGWVIYLTTQSDEPPAGVFKLKLDYFRDVRDGKIHDPKRLGVLYEFPTEMLKSKAYLEPKNFYVTNPNMGRSVSQEWLEDNLRIERVKQDGAFQKFLAKHLNVQIGMNLRADRWSGADYWELQALVPGLTLDQLLEECEVVDVGVDGGGLDDLLGASVIGRRRNPETFTIPAHVDEETGETIPERQVTKKRWLLWTRAWAHKSVLERRQEIAPMLRDFAKQGHLRLVQNVGDDVVELVMIVSQCEESGLLDKVGCDPAGLGSILDAFAEAGVPEEKIIGISQGWKMTGAIKTTAIRPVRTSCCRICAVNLSAVGMTRAAWMRAAASAPRRATSSALTNITSLRTPSSDLPARLSTTSAAAGTGSPDSRAALRPVRATSRSCLSSSTEEHHGPTNQGRLCVRPGDASVRRASHARCLRSVAGRGGRFPDPR